MITVIATSVNVYKNTKDGFYYYGRKLDERDIFIQTVLDEDVAFDLVSKFNNIERQKIEDNL